MLREATVMRQAITPFSLFQAQIGKLQSQLPGVLDGNVDSIHDARVATRRIRELLPLVSNPGGRNGAGDLTRRFKRIGRSLGRVRDTDVRIELLSSLETRVPAAAASLVIERQRQERRRVRRARKLIKRLEQLDVDTLIDALAEGHGGWARRMPWNRAGNSSWQRRLEHTVGERASAARDAIKRASGIYFPNRTHAARIAIKRFRYALEIADETGAVPLDDAISELTAGQDLLGDLHDRHALVDELADRSSRNHEACVPQHLELVTKVIDEECREQYGGYLARRSRLLDICRAWQPSRRPRLPGPSVLTIGALAVSSGLYVAAHRRRH